MASPSSQGPTESLRSIKIREMSAHTARVHSVAWSCDGERLASGSVDQTAGVFMLEKDRLVTEHYYRGHSDSVDQLCWHPTNPDLFVTASLDKSIRIWDVRTTKCIAAVNTKGENINICWSPDGQTIAVGNKDDVVSFVDTKTHRFRAEKQFKFEVNEISWNNDNDMFFLTNGNGCINLLSYPDLKPIQSIKAHPSNCICIKFDPTGKYFATGSTDALVSLWDVDELVCVRCFSRLEWPVRTLSFSHDGKMLASASEDHFIDIADIETGEGAPQTSSSCSGSLSSSLQGRTSGRSSATPPPSQWPGTPRGYCWRTPAMSRTVSTTAAVTWGWSDSLNFQITPENDT
ncbi:THO complex subunit 3-like isoform 1-T1 [Synchiropus picturatus]